MAIEKKSKWADVGSNFIPIGLVVAAAPVILMALQAYYTSEANAESLEYLRDQRQKFDLRFVDKNRAVENKVNAIDKELAKLNVKVIYVKEIVTEIRDAQKKNK